MDSIMGGMEEMSFANIKNYDNIVIATGGGIVHRDGKAL